MIATYLPGKGMAVSIINGNAGINVLLPPDMTVGAIANYVRELTEWLS